LRATVPAGHTPAIIAISPSKNGLKDRKLTY